MTAPLSLFYSLQDQIGYHFKDLALLQSALTHKSASVDKAKGVNDYERLEFLGDRILGQAVAHALYQHFTSDHQGALTKRYHGLVQQDALAKIAATLRLETLIITDSTRQAAKQPSVLSDVVEALIAAIYLDGGQDAATSFIMRYIDITDTSADDGDANPKSALQEWTMARKMPLPRYQLVKTTGPDHAPIFVIEAMIEGVASLTGEGASKKSAEQQAAKALLALLKQNEDS